MRDISKMDALRIPPARAIRLRDVLGFESKVRYLVWRCLKAKSQLRVALKSGLKIILRPPPARDLTTAHDIFVSEIYDLNPHVDTLGDGLVVDVGANVGYSCLYFANLLRRNPILAVEPHPVFSAILKQQLDANGFSARTRIAQVAAHVRDGRALLSDAEDSSTIVNIAGTGTYPIEMVDLFALVGSEAVALLKMDIEGGEYPILEDPRFEKLNCRMVMLEWHATTDANRGRDWCFDRLRKVGYGARVGKQDGTQTGLIVALRR